MRSRLAAVAVGGLTCVLAGGALALPPSAQVDPEADAWVLLESAERAGTAQSYHGTQFVVLWSPEGATSALVDIAHVAGRGSMLKIAATPHNDGDVIFEDDSAEGGSNVARFSDGTLDLLRRNFSGAVEGAARVAGRDATVVSVRRADGSTAARFWIDRSTRLVLRREVLDDRGRTVRASAFVQVDLGAAPMTTVTHDSRARAAGESLDMAALDGLRAEGWVAPAMLPRGLELFDARLRGAGDERVLHLSYSDGVSTISLFEQEGRLDTGDLAGWRRERMAGARAWVQDSFPRRVVWEGKGKVFTAVAECERAALDEVVAAMPHRKSDRPLLGRLTRGLRRVASWFNPLG